MPFLNNAKFKEFRTAASNNDEKAKMILQALRQGSQDDVDRLVQEYYNIPSEQIINEEVVQEPQNQQPIEMQEEVIQSNMNDDVPQIEDLTEVLDNETDGLFDENEIEPVDFNKFLSNKKRDANRAKKNNDYFKSFNPESRANYIEKKKNDYKLKFGDSIHDIDRNFADYDKAIDVYSQGVNDLLDDNIDMDVNAAGNVYDEITNNNGIMHSFGRHWDENDTSHIIDDLKDLVQKYGKKNVLAALNILKTDNSNFKDYRLGQINEELERYNKTIDKILK